MKTKKNIVNVKQHTQASNKGRLFIVKQHNRKNVASKIKQFSIQAIKDSYALAKQYKDKPIDKNKLEDFKKNLKLKTIKFAVSDLKVGKKDAVKHANIIHSHISRITDSVFNNKRLNISFNDNVIKKAKHVTPTLKLEKSKFLFGYNGNGNVADKAINSKKINEGDVFYNQNISADKSWGDTMKRKGLKIVQVGKTANDGSKTQVRYFKPENGKMTSKLLNVKKDGLIKVLKGDIQNEFTRIK